MYVQNLTFGADQGIMSPPGTRGRTHTPFLSWGSSPLMGLKAYPHPCHPAPDGILKSKDRCFPYYCWQREIGGDVQSWSGGPDPSSTDSRPTSSYLAITYSRERHKKGLISENLEQFSVLRFKYRRKSALDMRLASFTSIRKFSVPIKDCHWD